MRWLNITGLVLALASEVSAGAWMRQLSDQEYGCMKEARPRHGITTNVAPQTWSAPVVGQRIDQPQEAHYYGCHAVYDQERFKAFQERARTLISSGLESWGPPLPLSLEQLNSTGKGVCWDIAYAQAVTLRDDGFPSYFLGVYGDQGFHADFLWKQKDRFYTLNCSLNPEQGAGLEQLAGRVGKRLFGKKYRGFVVFELFPDEVEKERQRLSGDDSLQALLEPNLERKPPCRTSETTLAYHAVKGPSE